LAASLTLLCHAATASMRGGAFGRADEPVDAGGMKRIVAGSVVAETWLTSPALAARQTAEQLGVPARVDLALRDIDHGDWTGRSFADLVASAPDAFAAWIGDPVQGAPGGEGLAEVRARLEPWLQLQAKAGGPVVAVSHPMVIRAALAAALDMPLHAVLRIDIAPLSMAVLSFNGVWRLKALQPA
jgi:broad specificity phosphatase PhoE